MDELVERVLAAFPQVYYACHVRHPRPGNTEGKVTQRDIMILGHVASGSIGIGELAKHMGLSLGTLSAAVQSLESRELLLRHRDGPDRRRVTVAITAAGRRIVSTDSVLDPSRVAGALSMLDETQREHAAHGLALLAQAARAWRASQPQPEAGATS